MSAAELRRVVETFWAAQSRGDRAAAEAVLHPDLRWIVSGTGHPLAREFRGREAFFAELIGALRLGFEPGSQQLTLVETVADVERARVVSVVHQTARGRGGEPFEVDMITVMTVRDGRIVDCLEVMDLAAVARALPADAIAGH